MYTEVSTDHLVPLMASIMADALTGPAPRAGEEEAGEGAEALEGEISRLLGDVGLGRLISLEEIEVVVEADWVKLDR